MISDLLLLSNPFIDDQKKSFSEEKDIDVLSESYQDMNKKSNAPKRKFFTQYEDELLTKTVELHGQNSWNDIAKYVPGKTSKQCRDRWMNYLRPSLKFDPWSIQDDQLLLSLVNRNGTHWTQMKRFFPNRSTNSLKNRFHWLMKNQIKLFPYVYPMKKMNEIQLIRKNSDNLIEINNANSVPLESSPPTPTDPIFNKKENNAIETQLNFEFDGDIFKDDEFLNFDDEELCW